MVIQSLGKPIVTEIKYARYAFRYYIIHNTETVTLSILPLGR